MKEKVSNSEIIPKYMKAIFMNIVMMELVLNIKKMVKGKEKDFILMEKSKMKVLEYYTMKMRKKYTLVY